MRYSLHRARSHADAGIFPAIKRVDEARRAVRKIPRPGEDKRASKALCASAQWLGRLAVIWAKSPFRGPTILGKTLIAKG
jgi:hypothetical protein